MDLDALYQQDVLHRIDRAFAAMIHRIGGQADPSVALAAGLVSRAAGNGDVCLDLESIVAHGIETTDGSRTIPLNLALGKWLRALTDSPVVGAVNEKKPMILEGKLLYLQRYWNYENLVAQAIIERCRSTTPVEDGGAITGSPHVFSGEQNDPDQIRAVQAALRQRFTVISGGPGTGKTTTIARIIISLHRLTDGNAPRIMLAAPTGKAAARMQEALYQGMAHLLKDAGTDLPEDVIEARTLHRLLGILPGKNISRYHPQHPLPADVIIVDEASMIDLALMAKLMQAVPSQARLIMVGDKDQLASVEAGSVMGDICAGVSNGGIKESGRSANEDHRVDLSSHMVVLQRSYRFSADSGIDELGRAINAGNSRRAIKLLEDPGKVNIVFRDSSGYTAVERALTRVVMDAIAPVFEIEEPRKALTHMDRLKILTPVRKGPFGVTSINQLVERTLRRRDVIAPMPGWGAQWYPGRPVIINRNDYYHRLFNGDVGITTAESSGHRQQARVGFPDGDGQIRYLAPEQLPDHETVYAMSVHKSQGTEFQKVLLILPDRDQPLLTRELIYTAVTRARQSVEIWGRRDILAAAIERRIHRSSGLRDKLWRIR